MSWRILICFLGMIHHAVASPKMLGEPCDTTHRCTPGLLCQADRCVVPDAPVVVACAETQACSEHGLCSYLHGYGCVADPQGCRVSKACLNDGRCLAVDVAETSSLWRRCASPDKIGLVNARSLKMAGSLVVTEGQRVIDYNLPQWRRCYAEALSTDPTLCGWMRVHYSARRHGGHSVRTFLDSMGHTPLNECLHLKLRSPSAELAAPATSYDFTLVFAPNPKLADSCGPRGRLDVKDQSCTEDTDCAAGYDMYMQKGACCASCGAVAVNTDWLKEAQAACGSYGGEGCPMKKCRALPAVRCVKGRCSTR